MANGCGLWYCFGRLGNAPSFRCYSVADLHKSLPQDNRTHLIRPSREACQGKEEEPSLWIMSAVTLVIYHHPERRRLGQGCQRGGLTNFCTILRFQSHRAALLLLSVSASSSLHNCLLRQKLIHVCSYPNTSLEIGCSRLTIMNLEWWLSTPQGLTSTEVSCSLKLSGTSDQGHIGTVGGSLPAYWMHSISASSKGEREWNAITGSGVRERPDWSTGKAAVKSDW